MNTIDIFSVEINNAESLAATIASKKKDLRFIHLETGVVREDHLDQCIEKRKNYII